MNFRELTNMECALTRKWMPAEHTRSDFDKDILAGLEAAKAEYFARGGKISLGNSCEIRDTESYQSKNRLLEDSAEFKAASIARVIGMAKAGYTTQQIADEIGVSKTTIRKWTGAASIQAQIGPQRSFAA
jgi:DNA invertase Pin-like site-specific DNA recombinase